MVRLGAVVRPAAGLDVERLAGVDGGRLPLDLEVDRPLHRAERVHVLDLDPGPERLGAARAERDVRLDPHLATLHVRVGRADRAQQELQLLGVAPRLLGGPDIRVGHDLHQRRAGSVEVDEAHLATILGLGVDKLACWVYVGPVGDFGYSYQHDQGRLQVEKALGDKVETTFLENVAEGPDADRAFERLAREGCKIIFGTSFGFMDPSSRSPAKFPNVKFEHATGYKKSDNIGDLQCALL